LRDISYDGSRLKPQSTFARKQGRAFGSVLRKVATDEDCDENWQLINVAKCLHADFAATALSVEPRGGIGSYAVNMLLVVDLLGMGHFHELLELFASPFVDPITNGGNVFAPLGIWVQVLWDKIGLKPITNDTTENQVVEISSFPRNRRRN